MAREGAEEWQDRYGSEPRKGSDILVQCLEREGVKTLFAYPGGASMEIHQALTRSPLIRNILCRHEQACLFDVSCARVHGLIGTAAQRPQCIRTLMWGRALRATTKCKVRLADTSAHLHARY